MSPQCHGDVMTFKQFSSYNTSKYTLVVFSMFTVFCRYNLNFLVIVIYHVKKF